MEDTTLQDFRTILGAMKLNKNDPRQLSELGFDLASLRATVGEYLADAETTYASEVVECLGEPLPDGKRRSIAECERRADSTTHSDRERLVHRLESIDQAQNAVSRRLRVLGIEEMQSAGVRP